MLGSGVAAPVAVCDIAVPLRLHSNAVDRIAIAEGATKLDNVLMIISDQIRTDIPSRRIRYHSSIQLATISECRFVEKISADDPPSTDSSLEAVASVNEDRK
jgi:hypothetical protein